VVTATPVFQRTERLRIEVPVLGAADKVSAELLDRNGKPIPIPVQTSVRPENGGGLQWATAELALAPLAVGDYVVRTIVERGNTRQELVTAFKVVP
jgi:hypothetical protein